MRSGNTGMRPCLRTLCEGLKAIRTASAKRRRMVLAWSSGTSQAWAHCCRSIVCSFAGCRDTGQSPGSGSIPISNCWRNCRQSDHAARHPGVLRCVDRDLRPRHVVDGLATSLIAWRSDGDIAVDGQGVTIAAAVRPHAIDRAIQVVRSQQPIRQCPGQAAGIQAGAAIPQARALGVGEGTGPEKQAVNVADHPTSRRLPKPIPETVTHQQVALSGIVVYWQVHPAGRGRKRPAVHPHPHGRGVERAVVVADRVKPPRILRQVRATGAGVTRVRGVEYRPDDAREVVKPDPEHVAPGRTRVAGLSDNVGIGAGPAGMLHPEGEREPLAVGDRQSRRERQAAGPIKVGTPRRQGRRAGRIAGPTTEPQNARRPDAEGGSAARHQMPRIATASQTLWTPLRMSLSRAESGVESALIGATEQMIGANIAAYWVGLLTTRPRSCSRCTWFAVPAGSLLMLMHWAISAPTTRFKNV